MTRPLHPWQREGWPDGGEPIRCRTCKVRAYWDPRTQAYRHYTDAEPVCTASDPYPRTERFDDVDEVWR